MTDIPPVQQAAPPPPSSGSNGSAVAALVLGICSIVFAGGCVIGLACGIIGLVQAKKSDGLIAARLAPESSRGLGTAGRVCSWIGVGLSALMALFWIVYLIVILFVVGAAAVTGAQQQQPSAQPAPAPTAVPTAPQPLGDDAQTP